MSDSLDNGVNRKSRWRIHAHHSASPSKTKNVSNWQYNQGGHQAQPCSLRCAQEVPKTAGTCQDILKRRAALWPFVQVESVEPTNNTAERAIRPGVLWRKGSFGTQSEAGSRFVESMMTVVTTLKQQQRNVLEYLTAACEAALRGEAAPSLLPASDQKAQAVA